MMSRTVTSSISFAAPFTLDGLDRIFPSGTYNIETDEELIQGLSFVAYRRTQIVIHLHADAGRPGRSETISVEPALFDEALDRDRAATERTAAT